MANTEEVFFLPPMAVARLGGSDTPLESFTWEEDPGLHGAGLTVIAPATSLEVMADGSVRPFLPNSIQFRDGSQLRPVAPFFELWVRSNGETHPLTLQWLEDNSASLANIQFTVTAANRKAVRRSGDPACVFVAAVTVLGNDHSRHSLLAFSPGKHPLVSSDAPIPLGHFQVTRPVSTTAMGVDLSVVRIRFTPARGKVYGPPSAASAAEADINFPNRKHEIVPPENRILNPDASWLQYNASDAFDNPEPRDTYDGADDRSRRNQSFGVVDDTCDVVLSASVTVGGRVWEATARALCGPPDFAPDRRPFYSLADDLTDRDPPQQETQENVRDAVERLGDLFQRVFETASLTNLDMTRNAMLDDNGRKASTFSGLPAVNRESMTSEDKPYFDKTKDLTSRPSPEEELPYASVAEQVHAPKADAEDMAQLLRTSAEHVRQLIRPAYARFKDLRDLVESSHKPDPGQRDPRITRDTLHDMRMPPYMRDSDATALSLNRRQYEFLMQTIERLQPKGAKALGAELRLKPVSRVQEHVARVVNRLSGKGSSVSSRIATGNAKRPRPSARSGKTGGK